MISSLTAGVGTLAALVRATTVSLNNKEGSHANCTLHERDLK